MIQAMRNRFSDICPDPLNDPDCLAQIVRTGMLDAPHLFNNRAALGSIKTMPVNGGYDTVDRNGRYISEEQRLLGNLFN